jgi:hypothetical protein
LHQTSVSASERPVLKQNFIATLCSFPPSMTYTVNDFARQVITLTLSQINKRNSMCERMLVDSPYLVGWPIDR